ncbi:MAG: hypothetical protein QOE36_2717 [Gaiellaceae bacterium]|jgi:hypothetical protein|nr:hypothetical protein [Gaiellaceae bacterium]
MTDQEDRERESRDSDETKFDEQVDEEAERRRLLAERLANDPIVQDEPD